MFDGSLLTGARSASPRVFSDERSWGDVRAELLLSALQRFSRRKPESLSRRVSLRVSLRWENPKTDAKGRKPTKEPESAKSRVWRHLHEKRPSLLAFLESSEKNPCLPAKSETRVASCYNS